MPNRIWLLIMSFSVLGLVQIVGPARAQDASPVTSASHPLAGPSRMTPWKDDEWSVFMINAGHTQTRTVHVSPTSTLLNAPEFDSRDAAVEIEGIPRTPSAGKGRIRNGSKEEAVFVYRDSTSSTRVMFGCAEPMTAII